jgi:hypothetical protein
VVKRREKKPQNKGKISKNKYMKVSGKVRP